MLVFPLCTMGSLKTICKRRLLDEMIRHAVQNDNYIVMVIDKKCLRVLSSCCNVYDVLGDGVTVVEPLEKRRQPLPELDSLYFISPESDDSTDAILRDFEDEKKPQYNNVHIFFSSPLAAHGHIIQKVANCAPLLPRIRTFAEFNMDFLVQEQRIFLFDSSTDLFDLYLKKNTTLFEEYANRLYCLCASLGEVPAVRFQKTFRGLAQNVAAILNEKLKFASYKHSNKDSSNTTLLILDRSVDVATLFLHDYNYQALVYDLLKIPTCQLPAGASANKSEGLGSECKANTFEYEAVNNAGKKEKKCAVLGEQDELWLRFRHQHIQQVNQEVQEDIQRFIKENATAKMQKNQDQQGVTLQAIRALPQYQEMLAKYWVHVTLSERCFDILQARSIMKVGVVEQNLACGVDLDGAEVSHSKLVNALTPHLLDGHISADEKMRLVLLYFTQTTGLTDAERGKMMEIAQLSLRSQKCIQLFLDLDLQEEAFSGLTASTRHSHRLAMDRERLKYFKRRAKAAEYELSRYEPYIKAIMEKALQGELHGGNYPYVEERGHHNPKVQLRKTSSSDHCIGRTTEWDWSSAWTASPTRSSPSAAAEGPRKRLVIFVLGGITHAEARSAYEVSKELAADVFLGGNCILTPPLLLKLLNHYSSNSGN